MIRETVHWLLCPLHMRGVKVASRADLPWVPLGAVLFLEPSTSLMEALWLCSLAGLQVL